MLKFVAGEPALLVRKSLAVADLHLGLEAELCQAGLQIPDQTQRLAGKITQLVRQYNANEIIINGDLKHYVRGLKPAEEDKVLRLVQSLEETAKVRIIKGNHDGLLQQVLPVHSFIRRCGFVFTHGHMRIARKPGECIITGHLHPGIMFTDSLKGRIVERVWLASQERIIMPAFNPLLGCIDIRTNNMIPKEADAFLLDGLHLGRVSELRQKK